MTKKIHEESIICDICGEIFQTNQGLSSHRRWHDLPEYKAFQESFRKRMKERNNPMWKGDDVQYDALHEWVRRYKPKPSKCEKCGKSTDKLDVANISGKYKRDLNDYEYICRECHIKKDGTFKNLKSYNQKGIKDLNKTKEVSS